MQTSKIKILDLFCKAGGASYGMFWVSPGNVDITGVDIEKQKNYPFKFINSDFRSVDLSGYDFIWASPPCQKYSRVTPAQIKKKHVDYIPEVRMLLQKNFDKHGVHYVIENVPCSPLKVNTKLTGQMFNENFNKERWFESSFYFLQPDHAYRRYKPKFNFINSSSKKNRGLLYWMTHREYTNAVPPIYSYYIFSKFITEVKSKNSGQINNLKTSSLVQINPDRVFPGPVEKSEIK